MYCTGCGTMIDEGAKIRTGCGVRVGGRFE
jgi:hypothetical protein